MRTVALFISVLKFPDKHPREVLPIQLSKSFVSIGNYLFTEWNAERLRHAMSLFVFVTQ